MEYQENIIHSRDGLKLHVKEWHPEKTKGVVCVIHGFGEHSGRYAEFAKVMNTHHIAVFCADMRGHGHSEGKRGHTPSFKYFLDDTEELLKHARMTFLDEPLILYGHSMGGTIALNYLLEKPIFELSGFIISSPWIRLAMEAPRWKIKAAQMMNGIWPSFSQPTALNASFLSRDQKVVDEYIKDQLVHDLMTSRTYVDVSDAADRLLKSTFNITIPGLVFHGSQDSITSHDTTKKLFDNTYKHIQFISWNDRYHEPHHDIDHEEVFDAILTWLNQFKTE